MGMAVANAPLLEGFLVEQVELIRYRRNSAGVRVMENLTSHQPDTGHGHGIAMAQLIERQRRRFVVSLFGPYTWEAPHS